MVGREAREVGAFSVLGVINAANNHSPIASAAIMPHLAVHRKSPELGVGAGEPLAPNSAGRADHDHALLVTGRPGR